MPPSPPKSPRIGEQPPERHEREGTDPDSGKEIYKAYKSPGRKVERLEIRRVLGDWCAPSYRYLLDVRFNGWFGTEIALIFTFYRVNIIGKNLDPVIYAIEDGRCEFIQDYHVNEFAPLEPGQTVIERIEFEFTGQIMYGCPKCKTIAASKPDAHLMCGDCHVLLIPKES
jgi:hypothetical protein